MDQGRLGERYIRQPGLGLLGRPAQMGLLGRVASMPGSVGVLAAELMEDPRRREYLLNQSWPSLMAQRAWEAAKYPGRVFSGEVPLQPGNREQVEKAIPNVVDLATLVTAPKLVEPPRGLAPTIPQQLDRLIASGGRPVKVGEISAQQLADIRKVTPKEAGEMFEAADGSIYASVGLLNKLRGARPAHADRLVRGMPEHLREGNVMGNVNPALLSRPMIIRPNPGDKGRYDIMVLDAIEQPGKSGVPTMFPMKKGREKKGMKP